MNIYRYPGQFRPSFCANENNSYSATIMHNQNNGFALVLAHSYTIICPTTVEKEISMSYSVCFPARNKHCATKRGNSDCRITPGSKLPQVTICIISNHLYYMCLFSALCMEGMLIIMTHLKSLEEMSAVYRKIFMGTNFRTKTRKFAQHKKFPLHNNSHARDFVTNLLCCHVGESAQL